METLRDRINKKRRQLILGITVGTICGFVGIILSMFISYLFSILAIVGFACAYLFMMLSIHDVRCPKCDGNIGLTLLSWSLVLHSAASVIKFCPFCGIGLDTKTKVIDKK